MKRNNARKINSLVYIKNPPTIGQTCAGDLNPDINKTKPGHHGISPTGRNQAQNKHNSRCSNRGLKEVLWEHREVDDLFSLDRPGGVRES